MAIGGNYNPVNVMMGRPASGGGPYMWTGAGSKPPMPGPPQTGKPPAAPVSTGGPMPGPPQRGHVPGTDVFSGAPAQAQAPTATVGPRTVRATGSGPFDSAYRQNLASYGGGQFAGNLSFNPTDISSFPGQPTGGGTAPVTGMPTSLMDMALAGQGFSWNPPQPAQTATKPPQFNDMAEWMDQFMRNGRGLRFGSNLQ